jgi:hypothetical protein
LDWGTLVASVVGAVIALVGAGLAERWRFQHERFLRREERHAETQYATLTALQTATLDMWRLTDDIVKSDREEEAEKEKEKSDWDKIDALFRQRQDLALKQWDAHMEVRILRERVANGDLRDVIEVAQNRCRTLVTSRPWERKAMDDLGAEKKAWDSLNLANQRLGKAIREYERIATGIEPSWLRRQWDRLRGWVKRDKAEKSCNGEE